MINSIRENFYILFITNINFQLIIRKIMIALLDYNFPINIKYEIIKITLFLKIEYHKARYIIHLEAYVLKIMSILFNLDSTVKR